MSGKISRRSMLKLGAMASAGAALVACQPAATPTAVAPVVENPTAVPEEPKVEEPTKAPETPVEVPPMKAEGHVVVMHFAHEFVEDDINMFTSENPGITMEIVDATDLTRFYAMYAAGSPPDLVRVQAPSVPQWLARKLLLDLTPFFETSQMLKMDDLMPANDYYKAESPLKVGTGNIYGMCKDFSPDLTIFINKDIFEKNDIAFDDTKSLSYAEIMDISRKVMVKEGDRIITFGYGYEGGWVDRFWMNALAEKDVTLFSEGYDKMNLTANEEAVSVVKWYFDMAKEMLTFSPVNPSPGGWFGNDLVAGQLAMCQYGFWFSAMAEGDETRGKIVLLPGVNWAGQRRDPTVTATGMIMTAATKVPDAAWKVFEFYNGGAPSIARAKSGWGVPALKSQVSLIPQETDFQKQAYKVLQGELGLNTPPMQFNPFLGETQIPNATTKYMEQALKGEITFEEMLQNIETEANQAIKDGIDNIMG